MARLDIDWIAVFLEVYKTRNVSRAAAHLGVAQASASIALNKLRLHFGDALFSRTAAGMLPTPKAQAIQPELQEAWARINKARGTHNLFDATTSAREFRLCITDISEIVLLPRLLNHLRQAAPGVAIAAEKISPDSPRQLQAGDVALAVGFMPGLEAGFYQQTLFDQDFVCMAASNHPRIQSRLTKRAFQAEGHIVVSTSGTGHAIVDKLLAEAGVQRRVALRLQSYLGVARIVAQTELLVIVPRLLGQTLASQEPVQLLKPPVALPRYQVKQHWHERFHADAGNAWLRATLAGLFGSSRTATAAVTALQSTQK